MLSSRPLRASLLLFSVWLLSSVICRGGRVAAETPNADVSQKEHTIRNIELSTLSSQEDSLAQGKRLYDQGRYAEARDVFSEAIKANAQSDEAYRQRGRANRQLKEYGRAVDDFTRSIELKPTASAYNGRGWTRRLASDYQSAILDFNEAIKIDSEYFYAYNNRAVCHMNLADYEAALLDLERCTKLNPTNKYPYYNRAEIFVRAEQNEEALAELNEAIRIDPRYRKAYYLRSEIYRVTGRSGPYGDDLRMMWELDYLEAFKAELKEQVKTGELSDNDAVAMRALREGGRSTLGTMLEAELYKTFKFALEDGADPDFCDSQGRAPLHIVVDRDELNADRLVLAKQLLDHGADATVRDAAGRTPMDLLVERGYDADPGEDFAAAVDAQLEAAIESLLGSARRHMERYANRETERRQFIEEQMVGLKIALGGRRERLYGGRPSLTSDEYAEEYNRIMEIADGIGSESKNDALIDANHAVRIAEAHYGPDSDEADRVYREAVRITTP